MILDSLTLVSLKVFSPLLVLLTALLVILVGFLFVKLLQFLVVATLQVLKVDEALKKLMVYDLLKKAEIKDAPSEILGRLVYWAAMAIVILGVASAFGLNQAVGILDGMLSYVPIVFAGALILMLTVFLAVFLSGLVSFILLNLGLAYAKTVARFIHYVVIVFGVLVALGQFGFDLSSISANMSVVVGAVGLAVAISFGLGCKDVAADFLYNLFKGK